MRLLLATILLFASCITAAAQGCGNTNPNCIVPTAPVGTSNNQAASTQFVQQNVAGFLPSLQPAQVLGNNGTVGAPAAATPARLQYPATNFYVNSSPSATATCGSAGGSTCSAGSDSNNCLTPGNACLTLQHVYSLINTNYDFGNVSPNVYLANTIGSSVKTNYALHCDNGPLIGSAVLTINGNSASQHAVQIQALDSGDGIFVGNGCTLALNNIDFVDSPSSSAVNLIEAGGGHGFAHIDLANITGDGCSSCSFITAGSGSSINPTSGLAITGNTAVALIARDGGVIDFGSSSVSVSNNLAFSSVFAQISNGGIITGVNSSTFGSPTGITGLRCSIIGPTIAIGAGTNPNAIFPGSTNCVITTLAGQIGVQTGSGGSSTYNFGSTGQPLLSGGGGGTQNSYGTLGAGAGGTGNTSLTANAVLLGAGTGAVQFATVSQGGRVLTDQGSGSNPAFATVSGDCVFASNGVITCTKTNSVAFAASATTDTTNASNISSGSLSAARLSLGTGVANSGGNLVSNAQIIEKFSPGQLAAVVNTKGSFTKWTKAATVDNLEGSATSFTCSGNPTITFFECGTSTTCASSPTTIGTVTVTAAGTVVDGTVSNPAITAGDYTAWAVTAGTCTALDIVGSANIHSN